MAWMTSAGFTPSGHAGQWPRVTEAFNAKYDRSQYSFRAGDDT
jgi:hypothetical protein